MAQGNSTAYKQQSGKANVAVDIVIFTIENAALKVILIQMKKKPFMGKWAFPGGRINPAESLDDAARRELAEKTGVSDVYLEQLYTFGKPKRDPLGRVISVAYFALINSDPPAGGKLATTKKYSAIDWFDVAKLPRLAYDHKEVASYALQRLRWKLEYTNIAYSLLPKQFTLSDLRAVYEIILGKRIDRRNFQRKVLGINLLKRTKKQKTGKHRPATLYEFRSRKPMILEVL